MPATSQEAYVFGWHCSFLMPQLLCPPTNQLPRALLNAPAPLLLQSSPFHHPGLNGSLKPAGRPSRPFSAHLCGGLGRGQPFLPGTVSPGGFSSHCCFAASSFSWTGIVSLKCKCLPACILPLPHPQARLRGPGKPHLSHKDFQTPPGPRELRALNLPKPHTLHMAQ